MIDAAKHAINNIPVLDQLETKKPSKSGLLTRNEPMKQNSGQTPIMRVAELVALIKNKRKGIDNG
mgnify:FL=1|tara:strand:+ start:313 stop:507 length:195 start_codon:yes stop_codon:yes gene_type:complete